MRAVEALREAGRDVASGTTAALLFACAFAATVGAVTITSTVAEVTSVQRAHAWVDGGAATLVQEAAGRVDGEACDALVALPTVRAAGAVRASDDVVAPAALPSETVPVHDVSPGFPAVVGQHVDGVPGVLVSRTVADALGVEAGGVLPTTRGTAEIAAAYEHPDDGRDPALAYAVLAPRANDGSLWDACWVTAWPDDDEVAPALARTVSTDAADDDASLPTVGQLNTILGASFERVRAPTSGQVGATAWVVGAVLGALAVRRRRLALASDRHVGVSRAAQVASWTTQALVWSVLGTSVVLAATLGATTGLDPGDAGPLVAAAARALALGVLGSVAGMIVGVLLVRESSLSRHVRER
jgi:hypothetical protein